MSHDVVQEQVRAWKPNVPGIAEVFHATFVNHRYPPHTHDTWTVIIVDGGAIRYDLAHHHRGADMTTVGVLPPHVTHDGRSASALGFRKRVVYLDTSLLPADLVGHGVDRSQIPDLELRSAVAGLHRSLGSGDEALDVEARVAEVAERLRFHLGGRDFTQPAPQHRLADQLRDYLDARAFESVTLADAS